MKVNRNISNPSGCSMSKDVVISCGIPYLKYVISTTFSLYRAVRDVGDKVQYAILDAINGVRIN